MTTLRTPKPLDNYFEIPLNLLNISPSNVRREDITADVDELANNIASIDLQQPIVAYKMDGKYEIITGQRRFLAYRQLGRDTIPVKVIPKPGNELDAKILSFSENIQRRDLSPKDKADVCKYLYDQLHSVKAVANRIGVSEQTVRKWLGYDAIAEPIKQLVQEGKLQRTEATRIWTEVEDEKLAIEVAKKTADFIESNRPTLKDRKRVIPAVQESPRGSKEVIQQKLIEMRDEKEIAFVLPSKWGRAMDLAAKRLDKEADDIARDATIEWLQAHEFFADR